MLSGTNITRAIFDDLLPYNDINIVDHAIGGKMIMTETVVPEIELLDFSDQLRHKIRRELITKLVEGILDHQLVETTQMQNQNTGYYHIKARIFLVKDDQVRILRTYKS